MKPVGAAERTMAGRITSRQVSRLRKAGLPAFYWHLSSDGVLAVELGDDVPVGVTAGLRLVHVLATRKNDPLAGWKPWAAHQRDCPLDEDAAWRWGMWALWRALHRIRWIDKPPPRSWEDIKSRGAIDWRRKRAYRSRYQRLPRRKGK